MSVVRKRIDILPPDWNKLFKSNDRISEDELINTLLEAFMESEGDKVLKVKVKFAEEPVIRPNVTTQNSAVIEQENITTDEITVDLEKELASKISNEHEVSEGYIEDTNATLPDTETITRSGRKVIKPTKHKNCTLFLSGLITSQFASNQNNEFALNQAKQASFFKAQLEHKLATNTLVDRTKNGFEPLLFQAD